VTNRLFATLAAGTLLLAGCAEPPPEPPRPVPVNPPQQVGGLWYLDQNWKPDAREWYYNTTQGSQIMPYDWFMALIDPATGKPFADSLVPRFGYLADAPNKFNPDKLAVGFVKDTDPGTGATWIGMTCAACHTGDLKVGANTLRIDGAPTTGDLLAFITALRDAVEATRKDDAAFDAFAAKVLKTPTKAQKDKLRADLGKFSKEFATFVKDSTPTVATWGPGRTDAFQMIFNRISVIDMGIPANNVSPNAPVSYPFLWDAPLQPVAQYNGAVPNKNRVDALVRNAGEVLGVFGKATLKKPTPLHYYYDSTVRGKQLVEMEDQLRTLRSPVWPDQIAGRIDPVKVDAGKTLYKENCEGCHAVVPRGETITSEVPVTMQPLFTWNAPLQTVLPVLCTQGPQAAVDKGMLSYTSLLTDPVMAVMAVCRRVNTTPIAGVTMPPLLGKPLANPDSGVSVLGNVVIGSLIGDIVRDPSLLAALLEDEQHELWTPSAAAASAPASSPAARATAAPVTAAKPAGPVVPLKDTRPFTQPKAGEPESEQAKVIAQKLGRTFTPARAPTAAVNAAKPKTTGAAVAAAAPANPDAAIESLFAYKARPLDGIWATAPYLHNGSVPTLYDLLLPAKDRTAKFGMGSQTLDTVKVGVDVKAADAPWQFDASVRGNLNSGHEYGAKLSDEQRWQLIEYLKTL